MKPARVLIFNDGFSDADVADLQGEGLQFECVPDGQRADLLARIGSADAYVATLRLRVDEEVLAAAPRLRLVATNTTGLDHLDLAGMQRRGIALISLKEDYEFLEQVTTTAELAFALLLTCARHLPACFEATKRGEWGRHLFAGTQLSGKTLGIIGVGRLGTMMCQYGHAFRMRVLGCDPKPRSIPEGVEMTSLERLLQESDFVTLHVHLNLETRHLLNAERLSLMKRGACLINTSRGGLIDEEALIHEMRAGRIAAAGLDVIDGEWLEDKLNHPLIAYSRENSRLYITPHVGGTSREATCLSARHILKKVVRYLIEHPAKE